jgi:uncharacterized protein (DUF1015 family)
VAVVKPFRALRYAEPSERVVAPPYDVISAEQRERYLARDPHNVVHLTLPDSEEEAGLMLAHWLAEGVLVEDDEPALWALAQDFVGPDGVARTRTGVVASLRLEPYEARVVLPHERTHAGPKEGRLRLLRATHTELEPIFLLHRGPTLLEGEGEPTLEATEGGVATRLWRVTDPDAIERVVAALAPQQLLIADGHHRYETALAYHAEQGTPESGYMMVVLVGEEQEGLTIFPTHRLGESQGNLLGGGPPDPKEALTWIEALPPDRAEVAVYTGGAALVVTGEEGELDAALVERLADGPVAYTPSADEAIATVDRGDAQTAFLLRPASLAQVWAVAEAGEVMPQKSTYFYPKLLSGLLFHPV